MIIEKDANGDTLVTWDVEDMNYLYGDGIEETGLQEYNKRWTETEVLRASSVTCMDAAITILRFGALGDSGRDETYNALDALQYMGWVLFESPASLVEYAEKWARNPDEDLVPVLEAFRDRKFPESTNVFDWYPTWGKVIAFLFKEVGIV